MVKTAFGTAVATPERAVPIDVSPGFSRAQPAASPSAAVKFSEGVVVPPLSFVLPPISGPQQYLMPSPSASPPYYRRISFHPIKVFLNRRVSSLNVETTAQSKEHCWYYPQRPVVTGMGCVDCVFTSQLLEIQIQAWAVPVYAVHGSPDQFVFKKKSLGLAECTISHTGRFSSK